MMKQILSFLTNKCRKLKKYLKMESEKRRAKKLNAPYLNKPLSSDENDQIGVSIYVDKIQQAISSGAEIIAIASDFGTGKSSLISLLEKRYGILHKFRYKFSTINLWGFVKQEANVEEIHRNFIYQLVSHLNPKRGSHLSKRMSKNFGVLRLGLENSLMTFLSFLALVLFLFAELIRRYPKLITDYIQKLLPEIKVEYLIDGTFFCYLISILILFSIITRTDIVFSSPKSEGAREIDENIIMDYYKMQVINKGILRHYVVVIEDLDRISNPQVIFDFLIELHKYYIPEYDNRFWKWIKNKVTFIVCIKPAAQLEDELNQWIVNKNKSNQEKKEIFNELQMQEIYSKIFDLVIELRRINIDNYDAILRGLLEEKKAYLSEKGIINSQREDVLSIKGIQWIIRGEQLSIREIKQRLNDAFILYEALVDKFGKNISFNKCIIVSYLTNAFSNDMLNIKDNSFDNCISSFIKGEKNYELILKDCSKEFVSIIKTLIESKQIQADYRVYFYNYPKRSYLYGVFELKVINAILYDSIPEGDFSFALEMTDVEHILYAIGKIHDLEMKLPKVALKYEKIIDVVLDTYPQMIAEYVEVLDYSENEIARTIVEIKDILHVLIKKENRSKIVIRDIITGWNKTISKKSLLEIRSMLCKEFKKKISIFKELFLQDNPVITINEVKLLVDDVDVYTSLINYTSPAFDDDYFEKMSEIVSRTSIKNRGVENFYIRSYDIVSQDLVLERIYSAIEKDQILSDAIDDVLFDAVLEEVCLPEKYINILEQNKVAKNSLDNIHKIEWSRGLSKQLCDALYEEGYYLDYIINAAVNNIEIIDFANNKIMSTIREYAGEIWKRNDNSFINIRVAILNLKLEGDYEFLFVEPYQGIGEKELIAIDDVDREIALMEKNKPLIKINEIVAYFNKKYNDPKKSARIINFIYDMCSTTQEFSVSFYAMNMDNIRFRSVSKENREKLIATIRLCGMLNTVPHILKFMKFTKMLLPDLEREISNSIINYQEYEDEYVSVINLVNAVTPQTIRNIKLFRHVHTYEDEINQELLKAKLYKEYLYSTTVKNKQFIMPVDDELLLVAEKIFIDNHWDYMISIMCRNKEFMDRMIEKEIYKIEPLTRERFTVVGQTKNMIIDLFSSCTEDKIISYLCKIKGFKDYEAAKEFVQQIENEPKVLISKEVYDHVHSMLVDQYLKASYTKHRNAICK